MSGLSGARVYLIEDSAVKLDQERPARVVEQGDWLATNTALHLPRVEALLRSGYVMERLSPIPTADVSLAALVAALEVSVWPREGQHSVNAPLTMMKVTRVLDEHARHLVPLAVERLAYIRPTNACLTHGDPTAENVMLRNGAYVVIDPLPSTEAVPDDLAVDVGKLLQSAYGWEKLKGEDRASFTPHAVRQYFSDEVFDVAELWCVVHFARTLPYASEEVRKRVVDKLEELLGSGR